MEAATIVLRGTMIESVEANCRILEADNSRDTYQLVGLPDELADPGTRVALPGQPAPRAHCTTLTAGSPKLRCPNPFLSETR